MAADLASNYRFLGSGADLALEIRGPTVESCMARAVEGVGAALADVHPSVIGRSHEIALEPGRPATLLRSLLDAGVALHRAGEVAVGLLHARLDDSRPSAVLEAVPVLRLRPSTLALPASLDWHTLTLARDDGCWLGRIVAHLPG